MQMVPGLRAGDGLVTISWSERRRHRPGGNKGPCYQLLSGPLPSEVLEMCQATICRLRQSATVLFVLVLCACAGHTALEERFQRERKPRRFEERSRRSAARRSFAR